MASAAVLAVSQAAVRHPGAGVIAKTDDVRRVNEELVKRCEHGDINTVLQVLDAYPDEINAVVSDDRVTALHSAARGGHLQLSTDLIARGAEVNARDAHMRTPLHVACEEDHADLALELIFAGAEVNAVDDVGHTALHRAVFTGGSNTEVLAVLIQHGGASPLIPDIGPVTAPRKSTDMLVTRGEETGQLVAGVGATPLMLAAELGKAAFVEFLVNQDPTPPGATDEHGQPIRRYVDAMDHNGWTALHFAAHGREMRKRSISELRCGKFAQSVKILLEAKADVNSLDEDRKSPLHRAAAAGSDENVGVLLKANANINEEDNYRWTPLHYACQEGHLKVVKTLLDNKAWVQSENASCLLPLAVATMENQVKIVELLVKHGADPNLRGKGVASPMMIVRKDKEKYNDILALFELGVIHHGA